MLPDYSINITVGTCLWHVELVIRYLRKRAKGTSLLLPDKSEVLQHPRRIKRLKSAPVRDAECSRLSGETDPRCLISKYINFLQNDLQVVVGDHPS